MQLVGWFQKREAEKVNLLLVCITITTTTINTCGTSRSLRIELTSSRCKSLAECDSQERAIEGYLLKREHNPSNRLKRGGGAIIPREKKRYPERTVVEVSCRSSYAFPFSPKRWISKRSLDRFDMISILNFVSKNQLDTLNEHSKYFRGEGGFGTKIPPTQCIELSIIRHIEKFDRNSNKQHKFTIFLSSRALFDRLFRSRHEERPKSPTVAFVFQKQGLHLATTPVLDGEG